MRMTSAFCQQEVGYHVPFELTPVVLCRFNPAGGRYKTYLADPAVLGQAADNEAAARLSVSDSNLQAGGCRAEEPILLWELMRE